MTLFTIENTTGYTPQELDALNAEAQVHLQGIEPYTNEWYEAQKQFCDEIARR